MKQCYFAKSRLFVCIYMCAYIHRHPLKTGLTVFPFTVPTCTAFAVLQHPDSTHFWIFLHQFWTGGRACCCSGPAEVPSMSNGCALSNKTQWQYSESTAVFRAESLHVYT